MYTCIVYTDLTKNKRYHTVGTIPTSSTGRCSFTGLPVSSTNKTDRHDIAEILLKVAVNTIKQISKQKPKSSHIKIVERGKIDNPNTQFYTCPLTFLACYVHFDKKKGNRVKLVLWTRISPLSEMMLSCK